nr:hypothetical protein [Microbacterium hydrocarbonoxydans]
MSGAVTTRPARLGPFVDAYPAGAHDVELIVDPVAEGRPTAAAIAESATRIFQADPRCRRIVLAVPELDIPSIAWAEEVGFRYVLDVEVRSGGFSLLVLEPDWVLAQPHILDDIPLKE